VKEKGDASRRPWQPCEEVNWVSLQVKRRFDIELGKMLQNEPTNSSDQEVPYLKAQHVQWDGIRLTELPTMWASPGDIKNLRLGVGDLLVCEGGEVGRASILQEKPPQDSIIQNALHRVRPHQDDEVRFLGFLLRHAATQGWFDVLCNRSTIAHFTVDKFGEMWIALPCGQAQRLLADYLDKEIAQQDKLVAAKEHWLELLAEKRRTLITRAVTGGLSSCAPLRDSGVLWLGQIPAHWQTRRAALLFRERDKRGEPELPLLEVSINAGVVLREFSDDRIESTAADFNTYKVARRGEIVFNKMRMWQGAVGVAPEDGLVSPDYIVAEPLEPLESAYAGQLFRTQMFSAECARNSHGIVWDRLRLYWDGFRDIVLPLPNLEEQAAIVGHIAIETAKLDALRAATESTIALLKERRAALIAAAITGQLNAGEVS